MRKVFALFFMASIMLGIAALPRVNVQAQEPTTIGVEPKDIVDLTLVKGQNFTVEVWVRNVTDLAGVQFTLGYNTTVLNATKIEYGGIFGGNYQQVINKIYDIEEYIYSDADNSGNVTVGDVRLNAVSPFAAGSAVAPGDADIGASLVIFMGADTPYEKHRENVKVNNVYDPGEYIYRDFDQSGTVSAGDVRLSLVPSYSSGSAVVPGDTDIGESLVMFVDNETFPHEKHRENVKADNWYNPGGYLQYSIMVNSGESTFTGDGRVCSITFTVDSEGESLLDLFLTKLGDSLAKSIDHMTINGHFANKRVHDIAVTEVEVSTSNILVGGSVFINVTVGNEGNSNETFTVTPYCNDTAAAPMQTMTDMVPGALKILTFTWDTTGVLLGTYTVSANASVVAGEIDTADNSHTDGTVTVSSTALHDIAITGVTPSTETVPVGQSVLITVTVKNKGNVNETFTVTAYYNETSIETKDVTDIIPGGKATLSLDWNTAGVTLGSYTIKAKTSIIAEDIDPSDNELVYAGFVEVVSVVHDIAITSVTASPPTILFGASVSIDVIVRNEGNVAETFSVTAYCNTTAAAPSQTVTDLNPTESRTLKFTWNAGSVALGNYTIRAEVPPVAGETDVADNTYTDGVVAVTVHDVVVVSVTVSSAVVAVGQSVTIQVTVRNEGNYTESFSVTARYDSSIIGEANVFNLAKGASKTLSFPWSTAGIALGSHTIGATAGTVTGEIDTADNSRTDGTVTVKETSTISVSVDPTTLTLGDRITINGSITPTHAGTSVTIWYRHPGENDWSNLTTTQTNNNGQYSHEWTPTAAGTYEVKANWAGDANTLDDESETRTIAVQEAPGLGVPWYLITGIIIIIAAAILIYYVKFRKRPAASSLKQANID